MAFCLNVFIEKDGKHILAGHINGETDRDAVFLYDPSYIGREDVRPISISLPFQSEEFSTDRTRSFFDGLLPEGYTRRCIAEEMRVPEDDYISILINLGRECLGAIQIIPEGDEVPQISYEKMTNQQLELFAKEGATESAALVTKSHLSLTGASGKAGLYFDEKRGEWYLPMGSAPSTHIVKQSHVRLSQIVTNEQLCLLTAQNLGIEIPKSFIVQFQSENQENVLFATKRYDREFGVGVVNNEEIPIPYRLHQEDFAQAMSISAENKYEKNGDGYLGRMIEIIRQNVENPLEDMMKLWRIVVFNYLIGNTDNHIKNSSLIYSSDLKKIHLAPAYDLVCTMLYETSTEEMALSVNGKYNIYEVIRDDFEEEAKKDGLGGALYMREFDRLCDGLIPALENATEDLKKDGFKNAEQISRKIIDWYQNRRLR